MEANYTCPLVMTNIAIKNGSFIVDLPVKDGDLPVRNVSHYQRLCNLPYGAFRKRGYPPVRIHRWIFRKKSTIQRAWGTSTTMENLICPQFLLQLDRFAPAGAYRDRVQNANIYIYIYAVLCSIIQCIYIYIYIIYRNIHTYICIYIYIIHIYIYNIDLYNAGPSR